MTNEINCIKNDFCPNCGSDYIKKEVESIDGVVTAQCACNYCGAQFVYNYAPTHINVTKEGDKAYVMSELINAVAERINALQYGNNTDGMTRFIIKEVVGFMYNIESIDLYKLYKTSSYYTEGD